MTGRTRRQLLGGLGTGALTGLAGCNGIPVVDLTPDRAEFPDEPPQAAIEVARAHVLALGRGEYEAACRDRCLLVVEDGRQKLAAEPMDDEELDEWAREAREWYGAADFRATSVEVVDSEKMDPKAVAASGYEAGYYLTVRYEGSGNIANPFEVGVLKWEGEWWVRAGTF